MYLTREELLKKSHLKDKVFKESLVKDIPKSLILAIISVESSGDPNAMRYEPNYRWTFEVVKFAARHHTTIVTENELQKFSFGLMQIMGATARDCGYVGPLFELLRPDIGLFWGCMYFRNLHEKYGNWQDAISAYNQGSARKSKLKKEYRNQSYVDKVVAAWDYYSESKDGSV